MLTNERLAAAKAVSRIVTQDGRFPTYGAFGVVCENDSQCATNTCVNGLCNAYKSGSSSPNATTSSISPASTSPIIAIDAAPSSLPLGAKCGDSVQCAAGAKCVAFGAWQEDQTPVCGAYKAKCSSDAQCATNTCNQGVCQGYKGEVSSTMSSAVSVASGVSSTVISNARQNQTWITILTSLPIYVDERTEQIRQRYPCSWWRPRHLLR